MFKIDIQNRPYDLHRPNGCTALVIEVEQWPGNEFGLCLPETVFCDGGIAWCNWKGEVTQTWERTGDTWAWSRSLNDFTITSPLHADSVNHCLWYRHSFENHSEKELSGLSTATCFHLVDAPEFISMRGERIWACLDDNWTTTDRVPRHESPDPRRVSFLQKGIRTERTVVPSTGFRSATMPEAACHPLIVAERFNANGSVGIAYTNFKTLFNNNDCILRCTHSEPFPLHRLLPGQRADQEGIIQFSEAGHDEIREHFEGVTSSQWKNENGRPDAPAMLRKPAREDMVLVMEGERTPPDQDPLKAHEGPAPTSHQLDRVLQSYSLVPPFRMDGTLPFGIWLATMG